MTTDTTVGSIPEPASNGETEQQRFERLLLQEPFKPLKAVIENLRLERAVVLGAIITTRSYPDFLSKLGYRVVVEKQIHEQDCYTRLGEKGGIRAVLPHHDTASYSTFVTLINFNSTVSTTANSVAFFSLRLAELKKLVMH